MTAPLGWALALAALAAGYAGYGWRGVVLALTLVVFWLLMQFSRALRAMRLAAGRPVGRVDSAVMLHAKLARDMRLVQVLQITRSLGQQVAEEPETFVWTDDGAHAVRVVFRDGRVSEWVLQRGGGPP